MRSYNGYKILVGSRITVGPYNFKDAETFYNHRPMADVPALRFVDVGRTFVLPDGERWQAIAGVSFEVPRGRFVAIVGPSGCGKSTLLNLAAGLLTPTAGRVEALGQAIAGPNRRAGYLTQHDALLPWKTALENVALGLRFRGSSALDADARARDWLERVGLGDHATRFPHHLSGGMRKRLGLAQHLALEPELLLLDEPFAALDAHLRQAMGDELLRLWTGTGTTVLLVTHDLDEAIALADEVLVMTAPPASRMCARHPITLPRPRRVFDMRTAPEFHTLYREIWSTLGAQVRRTLAETAR
jgi:NitT/TauT family transport system ATP-binding protein